MQVFGGKTPSFTAAPSASATYSTVSQAAVNQMANAAASAGPSSTIKTSPQGANSLATIKNPVMPGV